MKNIILFASLGFASGLLFVNMYNSLIDTKSWGANIPESIGVAREYYRSVNPGNFYRVFSPLNQVIALSALLLFWKSAPSARLMLGIALVIYVLVDVLTFAYFYPRNDVMFKTASLTDAVTLKKAWTEWNFMNWFRSMLLFVGLFFTSLSIHKIYLLK